MKNKLFQFFKIFLVNILVISILFPSYATISSSDGSAFVTKAEFDSVLAEFNNRLTTFEAGINSKIDSQVTTYLDRNGIWSGKAQDVLELGSGKALTSLDTRTSCLLSALFMPGSSSTYGFLTSGATHKGDSATIGDINACNVVKIPAETHFRANTWPLVTKLNKSGVLYITWEVNGYRDDDTEQAAKYMSYNPFIVKSGDGIWEWWGYCCLGFSTTDTPTKLNDILGIYILYDGSARAGSSVAYFMFAEKSNPLWGETVMFFVKKNQPLYFAEVMMGASGSSYVGWGAYHSSNDAYTPTSREKHTGDVFLHIRTADIY